ncbi:HupE/UreJ family protein [Massilia atriviolacea]|uniref:HupE/UreJ family protein n=1 Tax=Massilia atriviolacea TaxID=2495579 RepID=A0A430HFX0_9BURK|nr:HupE/UreJ family protein [Massilia atriviolacea]RSZ56428.1 HupE/UreJ family protein [Massilia atriviolacea]
MMGRSLLALLALALALALAAAPARAHKPSDSYLTLKVAGQQQDGQQIDGQWDIALRDLDFALNLDQDGDGALTWDEIRSQHASIASYALARLSLSSGDAACPIAAGEQLIDHHTDGAYTVLRFRATCPAAGAALGVGYRLFADLDPQHKGLVKLEHAGATSSAIFGPEAARQQLSLRAPGKLAQFVDYLRHGVWHIWIGFDHILFLLSLLLPAVIAPSAMKEAQTLRAAFIDVLKVVTAFTLAHSLTLTLASLQVLSLPSRWVESAIAASVLLAAVNNIVPLFRARRPLAAFVFGLIHGFGFAGVLADLGLPQGALVLSLAGFNVGVELGQLAIVAVFLPLAFLTRRTWFYRQLMSTGSVAIALIAGVWLFERAFDMKVLPV